jgi:hypothetical protein
MSKVHVRMRQTIFWWDDSIDVKQTMVAEPGRGRFIILAEQVPDPAPTSNLTFNMYRNSNII